MTSKYNPNNPKKLIVEGEQDRRVIPELIEANGVPWEIKGQPVVDIEVLGNNDFTNEVLISTLLKESRLTALGLILDADDNPQGKWQGIRNACLPSIPNFPEELPETGLIHTAPNGVNFGVWIMPDNRMGGMLETFLTYLIPNESDLLWEYAQEAVAEAKTKSAPFKTVHSDKANIYTWLAWQNPPGRQLHNAIMEKILNPQHPNAQTFVNWFKSLYSL